MKIPPVISVVSLIIIVLLLTVITQIGGLVLLIALFIGLFLNKHLVLKTVVLFFTIYLGATFFVLPNIAPRFGRIKIQENENVQIVSPFYVLCNRNYVVPELHDILQDLGEDLAKSNIRLNILDANFPLIDGFPLLPHRSHADGQKVDLSLVYEYPDGEVSLFVKSRSGYGIFEEPKGAEINQSQLCKESGNAYYDIAKYLRLGIINQELKFSELGTQVLIGHLISSDIGKLFLEPHLKQRLGLNHSKIRFHGCKATRHDDHIHIQL